jgi:hypothetical protein
MRIGLMKAGLNKTGTSLDWHSGAACLWRFIEKLWPALQVNEKLLIIEELEMKQATKQPVKKLTPADQIKALSEVNQADELLARHGVGLTPAHFRKAVKAILK